MLQSLVEAREEVALFDYRREVKSESNRSGFDADATSAAPLARTIREQRFDRRPGVRSTCLPLGTARARLRPLPDRIAGLC